MDEWKSFLGRQQAIHPCRRRLLFYHHVNYFPEGKAALPIPQKSKLGHYPPGGSLAEPYTQA